MKKYKPSYLYIKKHNETGLKYFGKRLKILIHIKAAGQIGGISQMKRWHFENCKMKVKNENN